MTQILLAESEKQTNWNLLPKNEKEWKSLILTLNHLPETGRIRARDRFMGVKHLWLTVLQNQLQNKSCSYELLTTGKLQQFGSTKWSNIIHRQLQKGNVFSGFDDTEHLVMKDWGGGRGAGNFHQECQVVINALLGTIYARRDSFLHQEPAYSYIPPKLQLSGRRNGFHLRSDVPDSWMRHSGLLRSGVNEALCGRASASLEMNFALT